MQAKNEISEELRQLDANGILPAFGQQAPYQVPAGYFEAFSAQVLLRVAGEGDPNLPAGLDKNRSLTFSVPEGYFDHFARGVLDRIKSGETALQGERKEDIEASKDEIARLSPLLSTMERKAPYQVPEGYFEEMSPILAGLQQKPLYTVPEGYFDNLAEGILAKASPSVETKMARVVPFRTKTRGWWKYSAAAVVAGLIVTIGWLRLHTSSDRHPATEDISSRLVKVSDQDLQSYLDSQNDQSAALAEPITNGTATLDINYNDINSLLGDVPDGELKQYMEEQGGAKDIATN